MLAESDLYEHFYILMDKKVRRVIYFGDNGIQPVFRYLDDKSQCKLEHGAMLFRTENDANYFASYQEFAEIVSKINNLGAVIQLLKSSASPYSDASVDSLRKDLLIAMETFDNMNFNAYSYNRHSKCLTKLMNESALKRHIDSLRSEG